MPTVLDWNPTVDPSEFIRHVRESFQAGVAMIVPSDSGYAALINPTCPSTGSLLNRLEREVVSHVSILAEGPEDPRRLGLDVPTVARRLMNRAWPAGLIVALPSQSAREQFPWHPEITSRLTATGWIGFRSPDHAVFECIFPALSNVALVVDTNIRTVEAMIDLLENDAGFAVSVGERPTNIPPTVVHVAESGYTTVKAGAMSRSEIEKLAARIVLFVCTGNTCRSPLAEALAKKMLADRLGCRVEELPSRGYWILSAGVAAYGGGPAAVEAEEVAAEFGADLRSHRSRPLNPQLLAAADDVIVMTAAHAQAIEYRYPGVGPPPRVLGGPAGDLDDPIGTSREVYRACAATIQSHLEQFLAEWLVT